MLDGRAFDHQTLYRRLASPAAIIIVCGLAGVALTVRGAVSRTAYPERTHFSLVLVLLIAAILIVGAILSRNAGDRAPRWPIGITTMLAAIGLAVIGWTSAVSPPLEASAYKAWSYLDQRWLVMAFLLVAGLIYVPGVAASLYDPVTPSPPSRTAIKTGTVPGILKIAAAIVLALVCIAPLLPGTMDRYLDMHEQVHLGAFQRMAHHAAAYLDARTQYGPGHQLVTYWMMKGSMFTLLGFRTSQAWLNLLATMALFATWFLAYGWRRGIAIVIGATFLSPLIMTTFWGWGLLLRWFGPAFAGIVLSNLLWRFGASYWTTRGTIVVALICGVLAWMAQENYTGSMMAAGLTLAAAMIRRRIGVADVIRLSLVFAAVQTISLLLLLGLTLGFANLTESLRLYFLSAGLVFQGMTNTTWSEPQSTFRRAFPVAPILLFVITAIALYTCRQNTSPSVERERGEILGLAAAGVPLTMLTLFRADSMHFLASTVVLLPLLILSVVALPSHFGLSGPQRAFVRLALTALLCLFFFNPIGNYTMRVSNNRTFSNPLRFFNLAYLPDGLRILGRPLEMPTLAVDPYRSAVSRLGFTPDRAARCCHNAPWQFGTLIDAFSAVHEIARGRPTLVDVAPPLESSGIYFLADLIPYTARVSRIMSIWTDDDVADIKSEIDRRPPVCILSGPKDTLFTAYALAQRRSYDSVAIPGPIGLVMHCLPNADRNGR